MWQEDVEGPRAFRHARSRGYWEAARAHSQRTKRTVLAVALAGLVLPASASALHKGIVPNQWDYETAEWAKDVRGTRSESVRLQVPYGRDVRWGLVDAQVRAIRRRGAWPIFVVGEFNGPPDPAGYARLVAQVARRYRGRHRGIEVWNEPNSERFWPSPNPVAYAQVLDAAKRSIDHVDRKARVIAGAMSPTGRHTGFLQHVLASVRPDAVAVHPYAPNPASAEAELRSIRSVARLPLVVTEFGWGSRPLCKGALCLDDVTQAHYLVRALRRMKRLGYVTDALVYMNRDAPIDPVGTTCSRWDCRAGLRRWDGTRKPSYLAYRSVD